MQSRNSLLLWGGVWIAGLLVGLGILALYSRLPVDGSTGDLESFTPQGFRVQWLIEEREAGLKVGDVIVRAAGYTVDEWLEGASRGPEWQAGGVVTYQVLRDGQPLTLEIRLAPIAFRSILVRWAPQLLGALAYFVIGVFVFLRRPQELAARLLMLFCITVALQYWGDAYNFQYATVPWRWPLWLHVAYEHGMYSLSIATICYFALVFPSRHPAVKRFPRLVPLALYASHVTAILVAMVLSPGASAALENGARASWIVAVLQLGLAIAAGIRSVRTARDPVTRAQTRWIVWSATVGFGVMIPTYVVPLILNRRPLLSHPVTMIMISAVPVVLAIVILRYRLFAIEVIINRSLVYGTLTLLLGIMYLGLVRFLTLFIQAVLNRRNDTLVAFIATMSVALAFDPLRQRVQTWISYTFYRAKVNYEDLLAEMSDRLASSIVLDQLARCLTQELPQRLQVSWAALTVLDASGETIAPVHGDQVPAIPVTHPLIKTMRRSPRPLIRLQPPSDLPTEVMSFLQGHSIELVVPLVVGTEVVGAYLLGLKRSGNAYNRYDLNLLRILGQQAASSVQNARLFQQVESYSRTLEEQVQQRTRELQTAYRDLAQHHITLNVVLDNIADALVVTDLKGRIRLLNHVFASMVSSTPQDLADCPLGQVMASPALSGAISQALEAPSEIVTVDILWFDRVYRASASALRGADHPVSGVVTVLRDITQEVEISRMKDEFVSMVSHELRTPLTSIIGFTHLIHRQFARNLQPRIAPGDQQTQRITQRIQEDLEIILTEGDRLARLITNVLDLSKIQAGRLEWDMGEVDIWEVIWSSVIATQTLAQSKGIEVKIGDEDELPFLHGDRDRLIQVATNLLSNAIKFTDEGEITIEAWRLEPGQDIAPFGIRQPNVDPGLPTAKPLIMVSVTDTGTGIAEGDLRYVFERFRQVGEQDSGTRRSGTGLGLFIAQEIIAHHSGQIWAESKLGEGSRFVFTLPFEPSPTA